MSASTERPPQRRREALFLFVIVVVFLDLGFFFEKQFVDLPTRRRSGSDFKHCRVVRNVLLYHKTLRDPFRTAQLRKLAFELDQCGFV